MSEEGILSAFRPVPRTGVIYVTTEAQKRGFRSGDPAWCNLGQGQPETGPLPGAPARVHGVEIGVDDQEYAPIPGIWELREAIADHYNRLYRRGIPSRYSAENSRSRQTVPRPRAIGGRGVSSEDSSMAITENDGWQGPNVAIRTRSSARAEGDIHARP